MHAVVSALARALPQLADASILKILAKSVMLTLALFLLAGIAGWYALSGLLEGLDTGFAAEIGALLAILATLIGGWLLFRIVALAVLQFFAEDIVAAVERRHYPHSAQTLQQRGFARNLSDSVRSTARAIGVNLLALPFAAVLLATGVGTALLFWAVNGWLLGRELMEMVWLRHRADKSETPPIGRLQRFALGGFVAALMAIPFVNLVVPVIGAAAATHLVHRRTKGASLA